MKVSVRTAEEMPKTRDQANQRNLEEDVSTKTQLGGIHKDIFWTQNDWKRESVWLINNWYTGQAQVFKFGVKQCSGIDNNDDS